MESLKELYKIGNGPSSSHTMGPKRAVILFQNKYSSAARFKVILYGSLALTGKGHLTDEIIRKTLHPKEVEIEFDLNTECKIHPNTMDIFAYEDKNEIGKWRVYSIGGGTIRIEGEEEVEIKSIYPLKKFDDIKKYCKENDLSLHEYVYQNEDKDIKEYLKDILVAMEKSVRAGIKQEGIIPGKLELPRKAKKIYEKILQDPEGLKHNKLSAYAYAASEMNASGGVIVTAPTCGSAGVMPAVFTYMKEEYNFSEEELINALATAGLIGNLIKTNASISGAECGCQAEVGTACCMAAAAHAQLSGASIDQIEVAAEIAMEHHLGLTCDPIYGYVQIPCIERNAVGATRAVEASNLAILLEEPGHISFDMVVDTMYETGRDLGSHYRETSEGGLAKKYVRNKFFNSEM